MDTLIRTEKCCIVYGDFQGKENQELFRCPRALESVDLKNFINRERKVLGMENDKITEDLHEIPGYSGYFRMYYRNGWEGRWMESSPNLDKIDTAGVQQIINWICEMFPNGCDWKMKENLRQFPNWGAGEYRYLLKPIWSEHYKIMFDTEFGNGDYPVRIYVYK